jgi:transcriptional regulator with XRE-family HTH domain
MPDAIDDLIRRAKNRNGLPPYAERRQIRTNARVSMRDLGDAVGVSHVAIAHWEAGQNPRKPEHLERYKRALDGLRKIH